MRHLLRHICIAFVAPVLFAMGATLTATLPEAHAQDPTDGAPTDAAAPDDAAEDDAEATDEDAEDADDVVDTDGEPASDDAGADPEALPGEAGPAVPPAADPAPSEPAAAAPPPVDARPPGAEPAPAEPSDAPAGGVTDEVPAPSGSPPAGQKPQRPNFEPVPPKPDPAGPFAQGKVRISGGGGMVSAFDRRYFALALTGGYFVLDGFELGLGAEQWIGDGPIVTKLSPQIRYVFWMVPVLTPYVSSFYRHWFITESIPDIDTVGGSVGAFIRTSNLIIGGGAVLEQAVNGCDDDCFFVYPEIILSVSF